MRVLLINPPRWNEIVADNPSFIDEERGFNPPLGLLYLAGYVKANSDRHQISVLDAQVEQLTYGPGFIDEIVAIAPDLVGITAMTFTMIDVLKTIAVVRQAAERLDKKIKVALGGPHVHIFPEETIRLEGVDYLIKGEGEISFLRLLEALEGRADLSEVKGLVYLRNDQVVNQEIGGLIADLDQLPFPARRLLPVERYNSILGGGHIVTTMFTSRGCPYACAFCDRPHLGKKFRARGAKSVVDEIEECLRMGIEEIIIYDDTFTVDRRRVIDICDEIGRRGLKFVWDIRARVDTVDAAMLEKLKEAGCARIHFGVESGTEKVLKSLNKRISLRQAEDAFREAKAAGMETLAYFMIGAPQETRRDIEKTIAFARKLNPDYAHITILTPYPATEIYRQALAQGVIETDYWREFARQPQNGVVTKYWEKELSRQELFDWLGKFYKSFYGRPSYILKQLFKIRSWKDFAKRFKAGLKILFN